MHNKYINTFLLVAFLACVFLISPEAAKSQEDNDDQNAEVLELKNRGIESFISNESLSNDNTTIRDIKLTGLGRVEPLTVLNYLNLKVGDKLIAANAQEALQALYDTGNFSNIELDMSNDGVLNVTLTESPTINRIAFEGNFSLKDDVLDKELALLPRQVLIKSRVLTEVQRILAIYRARGNFNAKVVPKIIRRPSNRVDLIFDVEEGATGKIRGIQFSGNNAFSNYTLKGLIASRKARWFTFFATTENFDENRLAYDAELIKRFYLSKGYLDFQLLDIVSELDINQRDFLVTFLLEEGKPYTINKVALNSNIKNLDTSLIDKKLQSTFKKGSRYNIEKIEEFRQEATSITKKQGFFFVNVEPNLTKNERDNSVVLTFNISHGNRTFVERVDIIGNLRTYDNVIRRELQFSAGSPFSTQSIANARLRLLRLGYFAQVNIEQIQGSTPESVVVVIVVEEKSTGSLRISGGYNTRAGPLASVSLSESNLLGKGQKFAADVTVGLNEQGVSVRFTEPYFFEENILFGLDFFWNRSTNNASNYERRDLGGRIRTGYPIIGGISQSLGYEVSLKEIKGYANNVSQYIKNANGSYLKGEFSQTLSYSKLDDPINPRLGIELSWVASISGGFGDISNLKNDFYAKTYLPIYQDFRILSLSHVGYIMSLNDAIVNVSDRYFLGGSNLRGFANSGAGPRDKRFGNALGGNFIWKQTAEILFPLGLPKELNMEGAVFVDAGLVLFNPDKEIVANTAKGIVGNSVRRSSKIRSSAGFGLRWKSPFGPLNFDFAWPLTKADHDIPEVFSFNFGVSF